MPILRYKTDYPNQVHQLLISVSRHLYVLKGGDVSYQKKSFEFDLRNVGKSSKTHVIHYIIRDHYSGVFYAEVCTQLDLIPVDEFLFRAWSHKENCLFCGMPTLLVVPKSVREFAPGIIPLLNALKIEHMEPTSGYQAGVREISIWEKEIILSPYFDSSLKSFSSLRTSTHEVIDRMLRPRAGKVSRASKWNEKIDKISLPPDIKFFQEAYSTPAPVKERKTISELEFLVDDTYGELEGRFEWGEGRDGISDKFYRAEEMFDDGFTVQGKSALKKIIAEDPQFIDAYNSLGYLEMDAGKYDKALAVFLHAFEIGNKLIPQDFSGKIMWGFHDNRPFLSSMHGLGVCYIKTGDMAKANDVFAKMLNYNPNDNQGIRALVIECNLAFKNYPEVLAICDRYPDDAMADTLYGRVLALHRTGKMQEASTALADAIKYLPLVAKELAKTQHSPVYGDMPGRITWGRPDEAYEYWERVGKYWIENPEVVDFIRRGLAQSGAR